MRSGGVGAIMAKILFIEDNEILTGTVSSQLRKDNHDIEIIHAGEQARHWLERGCYDLIIFSWKANSKQALSLLKWYRQSGTAPIIVLTQCATIEERSEYLDAGADDCLINPFSLRELSSRVRALLRRPGMICDYYRIGDCVLNPTSLSANIEGKQVKLRPREFALLEFLARHPQQIFKANDLLLRVWPSNSDVSSEALRTTVKRIRQQLGERIIEVIAGAGYKLGNC